MAPNVQSRLKFYQFCYDTTDRIVKFVKPIINKIIALAKEFFIYIGVLRPPSYHLEPRQSLFIEQFKLNPENYRRAEHHNLSQGLAIEPSASPLAPQNHPRKHDDYLERMKSYVHDFSQKLSRCIFEKHGSKLLEICKKAPPDLPEKMRTVIYWVYALGDKHNKPLYKKICANRNTSRWTPDMKAFLSWAKGDSGGDIYVKLITELPSKIQVKNLPHGQNIEDYTSQVLGILFNSEATDMGDLYKNKNLEPHVLDDVFQEAVLALFDSKINRILNQFNAIFQKQLPAIMREMLEINSVKIADLMANRIADLIQNIGEEQLGVGNPNYIKMFDAIMGKINEQALAFLDAEAKTKSSVVNADFLRHFRESDICHDMIRGKILPISAEQNISLEEYYKKLDTVIYSVITENFLELLLPSKEKNVNGRIQKLDGAHGIIEHIELPPLFYELMADVKKIAIEITTPDTMELVGKIIEPLESLFEKFLLSNVHGMIFEGTRTALSNMVKLLSDRDQLDAYIGEKILPVLNHRLVCTLTSETIRHHINEFAPHFKQLTMDHNRNETFDKLIQSLYEKVKKGMVQFDLAKEIPIDQFKGYVSYLVEEVENMLRYEKASPSRNQPLENPEVAALMKSYYTSSYKADNPLYAHLVMNAVFRIGNFGKFTEKLLGFSSLQTLISTSIVSSMKRVRTSPRQMIDNCLKIAQKRFGTEEEIIKVLSVQKIDIPEAEKPAALEAKKRNMQEQMDKASRLVYDLVYGNISRSVGGHLVAASVLGKDASHLKMVMETCYRKFFGNGILAQNLLYQIQDVVVGAFRESALRVKLQE